VAGTIGAVDNSVGVVGVAPGARIHGLKVCNAYGECPNSAILAAVDWVTARSATIEVVNMSLIGPGVNNPLDQAITRSVDAGVVYVVAAGNNGKATGGKWQRANPARTAFGPLPFQLTTTTSGVTALVTGAAAGADVGAGDIDGGVTSVRSGLITLPSSGALTLTARCYLAYLSGARADDYLRISVVVGTTRTKVFEIKGVAKTNKAAAWATATVSLTPYAGKQIRLLVEAADAGTASTVEAAVDDVKISQQR
jgi:hypothetical protein